MTVATDPTEDHQYHDDEYDDPGFDKWVDNPPQPDHDAITAVPSAPGLLDNPRGSERTSWYPQPNPETFGDITPAPPPTILVRCDGKALIYPAAINGLHGPSGEGKSWTAKVAAGDEMRQGHHVLWTDHEDAYEQVTADLVALGYDYVQFREFWHYLAPEEPLINRQGVWTGGGIDYLHALADFTPSLVVVDGITDGMNLHGLSPSDNDDYATFKRVALDPAAKMGAAVLTVDHVTKNDSKGYAIGAQHKRAGMTGASYEVKTITPFALGHDGMFKLICRKAKRGHWRKGEVVAEAHVTTADGGALTIEIRNPTNADAERREGWSRTTLMDRVSCWLESNPGEHSLTAVRKNVTGKGEFIDIALETLVDAGYVTRRVQGQGNYHTHLDRYHQGDDIDAHQEAP